MPGGGGAYWRQRWARGVARLGPVQPGLHQEHAITQKKEELPQSDGPPKMSGWSPVQQRCGGTPVSGRGVWWL
jgi:hypothetical protein